MQKRMYLVVTKKDGEYCSLSLPFIYRFMLLANRFVLKILFVCRGMYPSSIGGAEIHSFKVAKILSETNDVFVIGKHLRERKNRGLLSYLARSKGSVIEYLVTGFIVSLKHRLSPHVISVQTAYAPLLLGYMISKFYRVPMIVTVHGSDIRVHGRSSLLKYLQKMILRKADYIISVSQEIQRILVAEYKLGCNCMEVVHNGVDKALFCTTPKTSTKSHPSVSFLGSLRTEKNPFVLFKSIKMLSGKYPGISLHIIGDGPLKPELVRWTQLNHIEKNVIFHGLVTHEKAVGLLVENDLFALTSFHEGFPTALIEALALSKPVVASSIPGVRELIVDGYNGLLFPPDSYESLAEKIDFLVQNPDLAILYGRRGRKEVSQYTWENVARSYLRIINKIRK